MAESAPKEAAPSKLRGEGMGLEVGDDEDQDNIDEERIAVVSPSSDVAFRQLGLKRRKLFAFLLTALLLINLDNGILAAGLPRIQKSMDLSYLGVGSLSSVIYFALSLSTVPVGFVLQRWPSYVRPLLGYSLVGNGMCSLLCSIAPNARVMIVLLAVDGCCQAVPFVYLPVWVNAFAPVESATKWMGLVQNLAQVGVIVAYGATTLCMHLVDDGSWAPAFALQGTFILVVAVAILQTRGMDVLLAREQSLCAVPLSFEASAHATIRLLCRFRRHRAFWYTLCAAGAMQFINNGLNYWTSLYLTVELSTDARTADILSFCVSMVGPVFGTWAGARYIDSIGGYRSNHEAALEALFFASSSALLVIPLLAYVRNILVVSTALFLEVSIVAALTPALAGLNLDMLPEELRPLASGMYGLCTNFLGSGMSTFVGGGAMHLSGSVSFGWQFNSYVIAVPPILLLLARATVGLQVPVRVLLSQYAERAKAMGLTIAAS